MKDNIIVKKNEFLKFSYSLTINEQRLLLACISQIDSRNKLLKEDSFEVSVQEIKDLFCLGYSNQIYGDLKAACDRLWVREIVTQDGNVTTKLRWVYKIVYDDGNSTIKLNFSPDVIPYLSEITERFTRYKLNDVKDFKCTHSLRIYELFAQYQCVGSVSYDVDELREMLELNDKYLLYFEFKRNVIERAISEINTYSNLTVTYIEKRRGRKVITIQFTFKTKSKPIAPAKAKAVTKPTTTKPTDKEEFDALVNEFANSRKRFGMAINETNVPENVISILKQQGRW
jgi:plasmid replication initiation protein